MLAPRFSLPIPSSGIALGSVNQPPCLGWPWSWHGNPGSPAEDGIWVRPSSKPPVWGWHAEIIAHLASEQQFGLFGVRRCSVCQRVSPS